MPGHLSRLPIQERFWARVNKTDSCWLWTGGKDRHGYGRMKLNGVRFGAHRFSLESALARSLAAGEFACHRCDVPSCVRPEHLFAGSNADNQKDSVAKGRKNPPHGSRSGTAKLSESDVIEIRRALAAGQTQSDLAKKRGVSHQSIWLIAHRKAWAQVEELRLP